ncbi:MAG: hypothetical protein R3245_08205 [Kiloniellales bacterium]|nr:hypothetical protein [Kiloniellales bacterium]
MKRVLALGFISYFLGAFAVIVIKSTQHWDTLYGPQMAKFLAKEGLLWPVTVFNWIA